MVYRITCFQLICLGFLATFIACQASPKVPDSDLRSYFTTQVLSDTLLIEIDLKHPSKSDTIPNRLFFSRIPATLLEPIEYLADSSEACVLSRYHFRLNDQISAYWVEIRQFWFQHHALFLYDESQKAFTDRITVAEWYGGEGGQVLKGSWIFDFNGDGSTDILRREIEHSMIPNDGEAVEQFFESASLLLWKNGQFEDTPFQDTAELVRRYPIQRVW